MIFIWDIHVNSFPASTEASFWWFLGVADTNDVIQKIEKTLNNTHTTTQKLTNNSFRNTKKHPSFSLYSAGKEASANREVPSVFYSFKIRNLHAHVP